MSKFRARQPVIHIPSFEEYNIGRSDLKTALEAAGLQVPLRMLDGTYYYTDAEGWGKVLSNLAFKSNLYKSDKFDCDNYAIKAMMVCAERYGLNTFGVAIGDIPRGRHAFNIFYCGDSFLLFEPNAGFGYGGAFEIGDYGYKPELVLI